jgi:hypothetical protein
MATITDLDEPFEGTAAVELTTANTKVDNFSGGTSAASYFTATHYVGSTSAEININGTNRILRFDLAAAALIHFDIYVDVETPPSATSTIINWYSGDTLKVGQVQMVYVTATTFQFRLCDASATKWTSSTLPVGQYRLAIKMQPNSSTGHSLSIYSGTNIDTTPVETSGNQTATNAGATTVSNVRIGVMSNVTAKLRYDGMTADDTAAVVRTSPSAVTTLPWKVRVSGAWVSPTVKTRVNGAWV